jgi:hypothetical protein
MNGSLPYSENMEIWHDQKGLTWCKDLSAFVLFLLADDVTLLRSLYTINVSSLSANNVAKMAIYKHLGY